MNVQPLVYTGLRNAKLNALPINTALNVRNNRIREWNKQEKKAREKVHLLEQAQRLEHAHELFLKKLERQREKQRAIDAVDLLNRQLEAKRILQAEAKRRGVEKRKATILAKKGSTIDITAFANRIRNVRPKWITTNSGRKQVYNMPLFEEPDEAFFRLHVKPGDTISYQLLNGGRIVDDHTERVTDNHNGSANFHYNYSNGLQQSMRLPIIRSTTLRVSVFKALKPSYKKQSFKDSLNEHCVFQPMYAHFLEFASLAKTKKTRVNRMTVANLCKDYMLIYPNGIPEDHLEQVAKKLDCHIIVENVSNHTLVRYNQKAKNGTFRFLNSRINHVEHVTIDLNKPATPITKDSAINFLATCYENQVWNNYTGTSTQPKTITTVSEKFIVGSDESSCIFDFNKSFDQGCKIDYIKETALCDFIMKASHLTINYKNSLAKGNADYEIDMKKAYTQFAQCSMYQGFPAIITNWRETDSDHDVVAYPGIYEVQIVSLSDIPVLNSTGQFVRPFPLLKSYGFSIGTFTLTSPWIAFLSKHGCGINILGGAWGNRMDFSFPQDMIDSKLYAPWTGMQLSRDTDLHYKMLCSEEFASIVMGQHTEENVEYNPAIKTLLINKKKDYHYIMPHIATFIISYTQIAVCEEAMRYDIKQIVAHKLDSIILSCKPLKLNTLLWEECEERGTDIAINKRSIDYIFKCSSNSNFNKKTPYLGNFFLSGQGGAGKTQLIGGDKGFRSPLYVSTSWALVAGQVNEYGFRGSSVNQLLGFDVYNKPTQTYASQFGQPAVLIVDELSMISLENVNKIHLLYPYSQVILMGDYENGMYYQSSLSANLYHPASYHLLTSDYRSIDEKTKAFKSHVRLLMRQGKPILNYVVSMLPAVTMDKMEYDMDYVLTGHHSRIVEFTKLLTSEQNHHLVVKHDYSDIAKKCRGEKSYLHGEILDFPIEGRTELTHGFTVHAFQGKTISSDKCFIDITDLRCNNDIYTALSRVRSMDQIILISRKYKYVNWIDSTYFYKF